MKERLSNGKYELSNVRLNFFLQGRRKYKYIRMKEVECSIEWRVI